MRYYVYDKKTKRVLGPFTPQRLKAVPGFNLEVKVALEGSSSSDDWHPAGEFDEFKALFAAPAPPPDAGKPGAKPAAGGAPAAPAKPAEKK
ncbi:MAG: hypothetical protein WC969_06005 [Elusimicrobiota bacterium]|jgi:hypothetical protein